MLRIIGAALLIAVYLFVVVAGARLLWRAYHPKKGGRS
jgi:hypothetical protein